MAATVLNAIEASEFLGITQSAVRQAVKEGHLRPMRQGRRSMYPLDQLHQYKVHVDERYGSRTQARKLHEQFPTPPASILSPNGGRGNITERDWAWFEQYARGDTYADIGAAYELTRQYIQMRVARLMQLLDNLAESE